MELIQHKSKGPVASLKKAFRKQMALMMLMPVFLLATNFTNLDKAISSVLFWSYVVFCFAVTSFAAYNYSQIRKIEGMDKMLKSTLIDHVENLQKRLQGLVIGLRVALLFFVILVEVLPYFQNFKMLNTWVSLNPIFRFSAYAALFAFQYFVSRRLIERKMGSHVKHLKELVLQLQ